MTLLTLSLPLPSSQLLLLNLVVRDNVALKTVPRAVKISYSLRYQPLINVFGNLMLLAHHVNVEVKAARSLCSQYEVTSFHLSRMRV